MYAGLLIGLFVGALIGFFIAALLAMSARQEADQEIARLRRGR